MMEELTKYLNGGKPYLEERDVDRSEEIEVSLEQEKVSPAKEFKNYLTESYDQCLAFRSERENEKK